MDPESVFRSNLALIDRVIGEVCRRARIRESDAEDFASSVKLCLIENDYDILRRWEGRSSLAGYLSVVIRRMLLDERVRRFGRWHTSAEAARLGPAAILLETLVRRDGRSVEEALPFVLSVDPSLTRDTVAAMAARLPQHEGRPRLVDIDAAADTLADSHQADARAIASDARRISERAAAVVRETIASWPDVDAVLIRFHYGSSMSIADISRMMRIPQRPLYRRVEKLLATLRKAMTANGIDAGTLLEHIGAASGDVDFGLLQWKTDDARQSGKEAESR